MSEIIRYTRVGKEDINFGKGTFEARLADGRVVILNQVDVGALANDSSLSTSINATRFTETGTWTPSVGGNATYTSQQGYYTKIGDLITVSCRLSINVIGTGSTNEITGLPYDMKTNTFFTAPCMFTSLGISVTTLFAYSSAGDGFISLRTLSAAGASLLQQANTLGNGSEVIFSGTYLTP